MIEATRCPACQRVAAPPEPACLSCGTSTSSHELAPEGRVLTYTRADDAWIALVELEGGARNWVVCEEEPMIGDRLDVEPEPQG